MTGRRRKADEERRRRRDEGDDEAVDRPSHEDRTRQGKTEYPLEHGGKFLLCLCQHGAVLSGHGTGGEDEGGIFAFGYSTFGQQMFILAYFGIRPFQITDGEEEYRFGDYLHHRYATCLLAAAAGAGYLMVSGYTPYKAAVIFLLVCWKTADGFADVYESEFQRRGHLHLTGKSNTFRTILSVGTFLAALLRSKSLIWACVAGVAAQAGDSPV